MKAFWHRFWDDFRGPGNVKNEQKRGRVALFLIFGVCKIRRRSGAVLGGSGGGFSELFGRFWLDFGALKRSPILKPKLEGEKVVPKTRRGLIPEGLGALILVNDQSVHDHHSSLGNAIIEPSAETITPHTCLASSGTVADIYIYIYI